MEERRKPENYRRMELYLRSLQRLGIKLGLENISRILEAVGNPHRRYPCILIGGTNGKGSVAALLSATLEAAGFRTGLYTSPHLVELEERLVAGGRRISPEALAGKVLALRETIHKLLHTKTLKTPPTFFETTTAAALSHFGDEKVQLAILEVGMGGRFDATNAVDPILSILTPVELDHQEFLGESLASITREKLGITRPGGILVSGRQHPEVRRVILGARRERSFTLLEALRTVRVLRHPSGTVSFLGTRLEIPAVRPALTGEHQLDNAATVVAACEILAERGFSIPPPAVAAGINSVRWPGRLQKLPGRPEWLLDGAHNPAASRALANYLKTREGKPPPILVFGALQDKDHEGMLRSLTPECSDVILCPPSSDRAAHREDLVESARKVGLRGIWTEGFSQAAVLATRRAGPGGTVLVTGSLYLVGEALRLLGNRPARRRSVPRRRPNLSR